MQVAQMQNGEAIECTWQTWEADDVAPQLHLPRVCSASPIGPRHPQRYFDHHLHEGQVFEVQEAEPLAKSLRLVRTLHAETQLCVNRPESGFETTQGFGGSRAGGASSRVAALGQRIRSYLCHLPLCACRPAGSQHDCSRVLATARGESMLSTMTSSRPNIPALIDRENLNLVLARRDSNVPRLCRRAPARRRRRRISIQSEGPPHLLRRSGRPDCDCRRA